MIKSIRLSQQGKEQLSRLKGRTGISYWNVLCRWALCISLAEPTVPVDIDLGPDSNVEMTWQVFSGEYQEVFEALLIHRCLTDGLEPSDQNIQNVLRLHLHRGISYLTFPGDVKNLQGLWALTLR